MGWNPEGGQIVADASTSLKAGGILSDALKASNGGKVDDIIPILKFGYNPDVDTGVEEDVWSVGGILVRLASAEPLIIASTDVITIVIKGVDNNYDLLEETLALTVGNTTTINSFLSVYSAQIVETSPTVNAGNITATAQTAGTIQFRIDAANGQTEMSHFVVPVGYTAFIYTMFNICSRNDDALVRFQVAYMGNAYISKFVLEVSDATPPIDFDGYPFAVGEKSFVKFKANAITANTRVSSKYRVILFKNTYLDSIQ